MRWVTKPTWDFAVLEHNTKRRHWTASWMTDSLQGAGAIYEPGMLKLFLFTLSLRISWNTHEEIEQWMNDIPEEN